MNNNNADRELRELYRDFLHHEVALIHQDKWEYLRRDIHQWLKSEEVSKEIIIKALRVAIAAHREVGLGHYPIMAIMLYNCALRDGMSLEYIETHYGSSTSTIVNGLTKAYSIYERHSSVNTENFRNLLMSIAEDVRVVMIMIIERLDTMRHLSEFYHEQQQVIAREVSYLYAPLAHRMGLYAAKTELEDLSLKYTSNKIYKEIAGKLKETKRSRDAYIAQFINPVKQRLEAEGLNFEIKGRTKSIFSIWNKIKKQQVEFEKIYDLFAIRIIIDCPEEREKSACWQAFSVVTDMYTANTNRLRDWISVPKTNGYESLHVTVMGPEGKWVEVQIRTQRMNEVAEKGLAAHWKYKGGKSDSQEMDEWLKNLRDMLETSDPVNDNIVDEFKMQLYNDEVFVFTPKGDLMRLPKGATVLDFAYNIHGKIGTHCSGAIINGKHASIRQTLNNGDQVDIITASNQKPSPSWLTVVKTSKARTHIKQYLKEEKHKFANNGREILLRRLKNWKIEYNDADITRYAKKNGYKTMGEFLLAINDEKINLQHLHDSLSSVHEPQIETPLSRSAEAFVAKEESTNDDIITVDENMKGINHSLAKCCNPIFGDDIFGFVTVNGGLKIHRRDCPNAPQMFARFGYRVVKAQWSGKISTNDYNIALKIVGTDDISIVSNITSVISKQNNIKMRSININSTDGLFEGTLTITVRDLSQLDGIIRIIESIKGVKMVSRLH